MPPTARARVAIELGWRSIEPAPLEGGSMSPGWKLNLCFDRPFWRDSGLSGSLSAPREAIYATVDLGHADLGLMIGYVRGASVPFLRRLDDQQLRNTLLAPLAETFGHQMMEPVGYALTKWDEIAPIRGGLFMGRDDSTPTERSSRRLAVAGTEVADEFPNEMEGALRSARQALQTLDG